MMKMIYSALLQSEQTCHFLLKRYLDDEVGYIGESKILFAFCKYKVLKNIITIVNLCSS